METFRDYAKLAVGMVIALAASAVAAKLFRHLLEKTWFYKFLMEKLFGGDDSD